MKKYRIKAKDEDFNLKTQITRASVSVIATIIERYGRFHYQEGIGFYRVARGSMYELKDHLISCLDLKYIGENMGKQGMQLIESAKKMLNGYIKFVKTQKQNSDSR